MYTNEWGVTNADQWNRDLEYFVSKLVLPQVNVPSFFPALRIGENLPYLLEYVGEVLDDDITYGIITHGFEPVVSEEELMGIYYVSGVELRKNIINDLAAFCNYRIMVRHLSVLKNSTEDEILPTSNEAPLSENMENNSFELGSAYETQVRTRLEGLGYSVATTPSTGDQGVDLIAERNGIKFAVQCKYYSGQVGNTAVQEVLAGKYFYDCKHACVVTNSTFTTSALLLANKTGVYLCANDSLEIFQ